MTLRTELERYRGVVPDWGRFTAAASRPEPTVLRVRRGRIPQQDLVRRLERQGFRLRALEGLPGFLQVEEGPFPVSRTLEHWLGLFYVQQASTGVAAPALGARPGERVLDLCAAPGGKTTHLAELMEDRGCLVASEISESRIRGLLGNVYRLGHTNVLAVAGDGRDFPAGALFDRVLVDAPCSGEGTLRRRSGRVPRPSRGFVGYVTGAQRALLARAVELTRPGGTILYVTCTFAPEENEAVVSEMLGRAPVDIEPLGLDVPHERGLVSFEGARYDERVEAAARIYPHHLDSGGLFVARLRRLEGRDASHGAGREGARNPSDRSLGAPAHSAGPAAPAGDAGWTAVPTAFPDDPSSTDDANEAIGLAEVDLAERWGVGRAELAEAGWIVRGGRLWLHTADAWPLEAWEPGAWRAVSLGLRAVEVDSRGRVRPTNDFLRWAGTSVRGRVVDVDGTALERLLGREPVPSAMELRGPVAMRIAGDVVGRGALTERGLVSEVPKARAADLARVLEQRRSG